MTAGMPDFYHGIDITYQSLGEITNRPKYGAAQAVNASTVMAGTTVTTLLTVSGKGVIYGGTLGVLGTVGTHGNIPILSIDGVELSLASFWTMNLYKMNRETCYPFYLMRYDEADYEFAVGIAPGYTFESSFKIKYNENNGTTPTVSTRIIYALI